MNSDSPTSTDTSSPAANSPWRRRHAAWLGLLITLVGMLSYFLYFYQFPALRDVPILNLIATAAGLLVTFAGCMTVWKSGKGTFKKLAAGLCLFLSVGVTGLLYFYVLCYSYQLPAAVNAPALETIAPSFALVDQHGDEVTLESLANKKVIITFFRGHW